MKGKSILGDILPLYRCLFLLVVFAAYPLCCSAAPIYAVQGEDIPLRGTAPGSALLYLFLTGPNLPVQGISLAGGTPVTTGVPASFTKVEVYTDGTWAYTWRTGSLGRILDAGTYTIYIVQEPRSWPDLDDAVYAVQPVVFGAPVETITVTLPAPTGSLVVNSTPEGSVVVLDDRPEGTTPLEIFGIPAGSHTLVISREGYVDYRSNLTLYPGERKEISAVLRHLAIPSPAVSIPPVTTSPGRLPLPASVALLAAGFAVLAYRNRFRE
jgi:hypothetical protein